MATTAKRGVLPFRGWVPSLSEHPLRCNDAVAAGKRRTEIGLRRPRPGYKRAPMEGDGNSELVAMFSSRWPISAATSPKGQLRVALATAARSAAAAWPEVHIPSEHFVGYLAERADSAFAPLEAIARLSLADLFLACGCARGDGAAIEAFVATYGPKLRAVIARLDPAPDFVDDVMSELREALLGNAEGGAPPGREGKITQYRGRASLEVWLAASATRRALTHKDAAKPFDDLAEIAATERSGTAALDHLRLRYPNGFGQAVTDGVTQALGKLTSNDRQLLRSHLVDGFSLRKLSHIRGVNVNVIARDFATARASIHGHIREVLCTRSGLPPHDADAVMSALFTRVNLGMTATLRATKHGGPPPGLAP
jgi:RNA polymerase sigma-70 factor, ECF subfamily